MSSPKKKIGLKAKSITFTHFSIVYSVELDQDISTENICSVIMSSSDIKNKDLLLKPTAFTKDDNEVIFTPSNVTPHFYQNLYEGNNDKFNGEYDVEKNNIYKVGDIVGYIIV